MIKYSISDQTPVTFRNLRSYVDNKWRTKFPNVTTFIQKRNRAPHLCLFDYFITCQRHVYATSLVEGRRNERKGERERRVPPIPRAERRGEAKRGKEDEDEAAAAALDGGVGARHSSLSERWKAFQPESTLAQLCFLFWGGGCGVACAPAGGGCRQREAERESVGR